jgi:redox-regulated HSP33 family molecular chaperone|tara:strand:+ start:5232 stop:5507 length:276 start_codon:yes stop_codon:yes gene_type:complete
MFLENQIVYIQFHPLVYMIKLNIEMSMATLVVRLAQGKRTQNVNPKTPRSACVCSNSRLGKGRIRLMLGTFDSNDSMDTYQSPSNRMLCKV